MSKVIGWSMLAGVGWYIYVNTPVATWWWLGKWVAVIAVGLFVLVMIARKLNDRRFVEMEKKEMGKHKPQEKVTPVHTQPQIVYMTPPTMGQQAAVPQAGLINLPLDKYEWEV